MREEKGQGGRDWHEVHEARVRAMSFLHSRSVPDRIGLQARLARFQNANIRPALRIVSKPTEILSDGPGTRLCLTRRPPCIRPTTAAPSETPRMSRSFFAALI